MKIPEEQKELATKLNNYLANKDYAKFYSFRYEVLEHFHDDLDIVDELLMAGFVLKEFRNNLIFGQQLLAKNYESMAMLYYMLLSCIGSLDLPMAFSLIKKSPILQKPEYQEFHNWENANYAHLLTLSSTSSFSQLTLLLMVYCESLGRELSFDDLQKQDVLLVRWFDLLNMLYEMGYPEEILNELQKITTIIFSDEEN
ncbi:MAG: hypothetical protein AB7T03_03295 [Bacilli bacterium]